MRHSEALDETVDERTLMPAWYAREKRLAHMLPYVSLVDDQTVRTRVNELFQCIRLSGVNSYTTDDAYLDKVTALFARIIAQLGPEFSDYVHKGSKAITPVLIHARDVGSAMVAVFYFIPHDFIAMTVFMSGFTMAFCDLLRFWLLVRTLT